MSSKAFLALIVFAIVCQGQQFSNRAAWQAAAVQTATIDFGTAAPPPGGSYTAYAAPAGLTLSGINFTDSNYAAPVNVVSLGYCCSPYAGFDQLTSQGDGYGLRITMNNGAKAVGFDMFTLHGGDVTGTSNYGSVISISIAGQNITVNCCAKGQPAFFGFISPTPIGSVVISGRERNSMSIPNPAQVDLMNFSYDTLTQYNIGFFKAADPIWALDSNGNGQFDAGDKVFAFAGQPGAIAITGDWNGDGHTKVGYYLDGFWVLDYNGNGVYDGVAGGDKFYGFGGAGPSYIPVVGDWNGDGRTKVGFYRNGFWALDMNGNGKFDGPSIDGFYGFGGNGLGEVPVVGDWNGTKRTKVGYFYQGKWVLDYDGNGIYTAADKNYQTFPYAAGDIPVYGDWNGDGKTKIGIYRGGFWILDYNGNGTYDGVGAGGDKFYGYGGNSGEIPLVGDWTGGGTSKIGIYVNGFWVLDINGNGSYDGTVGGNDRFIAFGGSGAGYQPIIGRW